jgi:glycosyltransferase involved in cell wall biosynthesis
MSTKERATLSILYMSWRDWENPEAGGSETFVERTARILTAHGHKVTVLTSRYPGAEKAARRDNVDLIRRGGRFGVFLHGLLYVLRHGHKYDVILDVQNGVPFWTPLVTRTPVVNLVHHVHREQWESVFGPVLARFGWWLESRVAPRVYRSCRYLTVSQATRAELATLGVQAHRVSIIYSGNDEPPRMAQYAAMSRSDVPSLVVLGRLVPHKQVELAIDVVKDLRSRFPDLRLHIAGDGYWRPRLVEHARLVGVEDRVTFHGFVDEAAKHSLLATSWVTVMPSVKEGWGLTILEAGLHETPTVAFRFAGGPTESIRDCETGLLTDSYDEFRTAVALLLEDTTLRDRMGKDARVYAESFNWEATGCALERVLSETSAG